MKRRLLIFLIFVPLHLQAAPEKPFRLMISFGEKITFYLVSPTNAGGRVDFSNNRGQRVSRDISAADYLYLKHKVADFSEQPSNNLEFCPRNYVEFTNDGNTLQVCMSSMNKLSLEANKVINSISFLF